MSGNVFSKIDKTPDKFIGIVFFILIAVSGVTAQQTNRSECDESRLREAQSAFNIGKFRTTVQLLQPCLETKGYSPRGLRGFSEKRYRFRAHRLIAISYIAMDSLDRARLYVREMLKLRPAYAPDPDEGDPLILGQLIEEVRPRRRWLRYAIVGGVAVATGVTAILLTGQDEGGPPPLPDPPVFPNP